MKYNFYLYGTGSFAEKAYIIVKKYFKNINILGAIENNPKIDYFLDLKVFCLNNLQLFNSKIIITSSYYNEIKEVLLKKGLKENKDFFDGYIFFLIYDEMIKSENVIKKLELFNLQYRFIKIDELINKKSSNKLFVFGLGTSINNYNQRNWNEIENNDSWGVNFFSLHKYKPTFYSYEFSNDFDWFYRLTHNYKIRENYPCDYIKDINYITNNQYQLIKNLNMILPITLDIRLHLKDEVKLKNLLVFIKEFKLLEIINEMNFNLGGITSITTIIFNALRMGYTEIILNGVDLYNSKYFYEENKEYLIESNNVLFPDRSNIKRDVKHPVSSGEHVVPAEVFIKHINNLFAKPMGVKIMVGNKKSKLADFLEVYNWQ